MYFLWTIYPDGSARHSNIRAKDRIQPQQDRCCMLAIAPPLHILNVTSSNLLEYLVMLSSTHVHNLARCSSVWNAKTPFLVIPRILKKMFPTLYDQKVFPALYSFLIVFDRFWSFLIVLDRTFSVFLYCSLRSQTFYPGSSIKWPGRTGVPPIPDQYLLGNK